MSNLRPTNEQQRRQLKAVVRRLLEMAGGVSSFEHVTRVQAPALSKYGSLDDAAAHMPIDIAMDLMLDTRSNGILSAMAAMLGFKLVALDADGQGENLPDITDVASLLCGISQLVKAVSNSVADGVITPEEERIISGKMEKSIQEIRALQRRVKAAVKGGAA
ncbi:phage regulatory CII family protein [Paenochrobactrum sp. BZR 588]|uniref:phage regulatory CII family protein n=1 Tax=Paenochrobactrum TaxID=999488 RepID=UPI0035BBE21E